MTEPRRSLQSMLKTVRLSMAALIIAILLVFGGLLFWTSSVYTHILSGYQALQQYYYSVSEGTDCVKNYLINEVSEDLSRYSEALQKAGQSLQALQNNPYLQEKWRFGLLENMLEGYAQSAEALEARYLNQSGPKSYQYYYEDFLEKDALIQETSTSYYHLLTESMNSLQKSFSEIQMTCLAAAGISVLLVAFWTLKLSRFFRNDLSLPLQEISENIQSVKNGRYTLSEGRASTMEMQAVYQALEEMAARVGHSIELEKENTALEKKLAQSELRMLQNQINPHFLFNTLNMIYILCESDECEKAAEMIFKTSHLLRYGLENQSRISSLSKELSALKDYIDIQRMRLQDKVEFVLDADPDPAIQNLLIPAMVLQPLVENSIMHGLKNCTEGGVITIRVARQEQSVLLSVSDNGKGSALQDVLARIRSEAAGESTGLGLFNVTHRMEMFYREKINYEIRTAEDEGFEIRFTVDF